MILQEIGVRESKEKELWYRSTGELSVQGEKMVFEKNAIFSTDTYYNSFSAGKWRKYCDIKEVFLEFTFCGSFELRIRQSIAAGEEGLTEKELYSEIMTAQEETKASFPIHVAEGVVSFCIKALSGDSYIKRMAYVGEPVKKKEVTIALNICTYQREEALLGNINLLKNAFLENENEELREHLKIFITDNGKTIDKDAHSSKNIFLYPNENVGGAGGFTRGLVEIRKKCESEKISHIIFMDDDIKLEAETIKRTYALLSAMKEEYKDAFLAGAMLRLDKPYIQNENGAWWNYGGVILRNTNMDLRDFGNVVRNEQLEKVEYAAWFYCCIPADVVTEQNLPLPLFIHGDDVEYGLRNATQILTMNGIAVAHPVVAHKCVSTNAYYDLRNALIVNACHFHETYTKKQAKKRVIKDLLQVFLKYRYKDMHLIYLALEDFCRGPEWLYELEGASYHKKIQKMGYSFCNVADAVKGKEDMAKEHEYTPGYLETMRRSKSLKKKLEVLLQILSLNGWLLPAKEEVGVFYMNVRPMHMYRRKKAVLYEETGMDGILVEKSYRQLWVFLKLVVKASRLIDKKFAKSSNAYYNTIGKLCSIDYWNEKYQYSNK